VVPKTSTNHHIGQDFAREVARNRQTPFAPCNGAAWCGKSQGERIQRQTPNNPTKKPKGDPNTGEMLSGAMSETSGTIQAGVA